MAHIGYARVSTKSQSLDLQLDALQRAGVLPEHIYSEKVSGAADHLPQLEACMKALRAGDSLVVYKLDRLGRRMFAVQDLLKELDDRGIYLRTLEPPIDTGGPYGHLVLSILAWLAENERETLRERTRAGLEAARERGRSGGRKKILSPSAEKRLFKQYLASTKSDEKGNRLTVAEIAKLYGISSSSVYRIVREHKTKKTNKKEEEA